MSATRNWHDLPNSQDVKKLFAPPSFRTWTSYSSEGANVTEKAIYGLERIRDDRSSSWELKNQTVRITSSSEPWRGTLGLSALDRLSFVSELRVTAGLPSLAWTYTESLINTSTYRYQTTDSEHALNN
jgi:hypothetical protein